MASVKQLGHGQQFCKILTRSKMTERSYSPDTDFTIYSFPWRYDLSSRSWHTLWLWKTILFNIIQIRYGSNELWSGQDFCLHSGLDLWDVTFFRGHGTPLDQGHDTSLGYGKQLCKISRSNVAVRSYDPDTDFGYTCMCTVTLTVEIWPSFEVMAHPWVKIMINPWVMDNNCVKYYPDPIWQ